MINITKHKDFIIEHNLNQFIIYKDDSKCALFSIGLDTDMHLKEVYKNITLDELKDIYKHLKILI